MFDCACPVFLTCEDDSKDYKPIILNGPRPYNRKVKIHGWQEHSLSEPHDNKNGGLKEATYKRFGTDDAPTGISVTRAMTEQIRDKAHCSEEYRHRRLLNIYSFPYTQTVEYDKTSKCLFGPRHSKSVEPTDYRTTLRDDFPWHYPEKALPPLVPHYAPPKPWLMYRRRIGCNVNDIQRRPGIRHFLDDDTDVKIIRQC